MADILIKNMEMPKACITGELPDYVYCPCFGTCPKACGGDERPKDCPLVELPPHGRICDVVKFVEDIVNCDSLKNEFTGYQLYLLRTLASNARTIVEANNG